MKPNGRALVLGATSGIGRAVAHELAARGWPLTIAGRDETELAAMARDMQIRYGTRVDPLHYEATDFARHQSLLANCNRDAGERLAGVIFCQGTMADQADAEADFDVARRMIDVNYTSAVSLLGRAAALLAASGGGFVCGVSSVAGDRGRQSNYIYGSTKAALTTYLQGLRNAMFRKGVAVITIKPGFVDTAMTWGLLKAGSPLVASPKRAARDVVRAVERRSNVRYTPWFWRGIMSVIRAIPEPIFKRMKM
jgi:short-subunit dehydrogenase